MSALYSRSANRVFRVAIVVAIAAVAMSPLVLMAWVRLPRSNRENVAVVQPIPFDHRVHARDLRIDCRYCHATVERSSTAGFPASQTCLPCHNDAWRASAIFAPVRASVRTGRPLAWRRVDELPDFVYFDHAIHVAKGVGCESCHGRVDRMAQVRQTTPMSMGWCMSCHRDPAPELRPVSEVATMGYARPAADSASGAALMRRYHVRRLTDCSTCHR